MTGSVIVPYHSHKLHLTLCLSTLRRTIPNDYEIIVVANNDLTDSLPRIPRDTRIKVVDCKMSLGYSGAINLGASVARGDLLFFCDADAYPLKGWLAPHLRAYRRNPKIGFTASKLLDSSTGRVLDFGIARTSFNHIHPGRGLPRKHPLVRRNRVVQMACSALCGVPRQLFLDLGGLDENLRHFYQDTDLTVRITDAGLSCCCLADSLGYHQGFSSNIKRDPFQIDERGYYTAKNYRRFNSDLKLFLANSLQWLFTSTQPANRYTCLNLSTMYPLNEYIEVIQERLSHQEIISLPVSKRDLTSISLLQHLDPDLYYTQWPLLILVDRVDALLPNRLITTLRSQIKDVVVDRHGNAVFLGELQDW